MDAALEKAVADYRAKTATAKDLALIDNLKQGELARYARDGKKCFVKTPGSYSEITEGDEVIVPSTSYKRTFPLGTPRQDIEKHFDDIKVDQIRIIKELLGDRAEVVVVGRGKLEIVEKDGKVHAGETFGVLGLG
jgi:hypothetical protein